MADENSRELIIEKAISLFAQKGYEGVGVQEICEKSGITKPTLYYFYKSKAGLLQSICETKGNELLQLISKAAEYEHDFINGLTQILLAEIQFAKTNPDFFNLHYVLLNAPDNSEGKAVYSDLIKKIDAVFEDFFLNSVNEFGNMRSKESLYACLYHNNVVSVARMCVGNKLTANDQTVYQIVHSFVYGVAN